MRQQSSARLLGAWPDSACMVDEGDDLGLEIVARHVGYWTDRQVTPYGFIVFYVQLCVFHSVFCICTVENGLH